MWIEFVRNKWFKLRSEFFFISLLLLMISFPFSESLLSISAGLVCLQLLFSGNWNYKLNRIKTDKALWMLIGVFFIYLIGCFFCKDIKTGLYELQKNIFWLIIPLGVALSEKISQKKLWIIFTVFISAITLASLITSFKLVFDNYFFITDFRDASYVSHVSFSLQIVFSIALLLYASIKKMPVVGKVNPYIIWAWCTWMLVFLGFQKSLLGLFSFYGAGIVFLYWMIRQMQSRLKKQYSYLLLSTFLILPFIYTGFVLYFFYNVSDVQPPSQLKTESGNYYSFDFNNKQKENARYVHWYICVEELEQEWSKVSHVGLYENDATGFKVYYTLIRYMTSRGLEKDSAGIAALSTVDIANVQNGISNHIFVTRKYSIYPRVYQTIWEIDEYIRTGNPNNQSLSQRFEYMKAALYIIRNNFWGIGTGNFKIAYDEAYRAIDTKLHESLRFHVHNQYLSYMIKFGYPGFLLILFFVGYAVIYHRQYKNILLITLLMIIGLSNMGETILETHIGLPFFLIFLSLFLWHSPQKLKYSTKIDA